jgi:hypothetical protein
MDYETIVSLLTRPLDLGRLGDALLEGTADFYMSRHPDGSLLILRQGGATYLFDHATSAGSGHDDRTVAAWALTPAEVRRREVAYQRGFPMAQSADEPGDRGHLIPHLSGGEFGPNIYRQDRDLNRGWSAEGRRYRAMEREAASLPGSFYFGHLIYADDTDWPSEVETGILRDGRLVTARFANRTGLSAE